MDEQGRMRATLLLWVYRRGGIGPFQDGRMLEFMEFDDLEMDFCTNSTLGISLRPTVALGFLVALYSVNL